MYTMIIYSAYVLTLTILTIVLPRFYDKILIRHLKAEPIAQIIYWPQQFVNNISPNKQVYWYDSAIPKAFASGKTIFLSMGLLELLNDSELRAVLAHETWHLTHNSKTPLIRQLALMTFINPKNCQQDIERLANEFAAKTTGKQALTSAYEKLILEKPN
jgi:heat shock protein HtpX